MSLVSELRFAMGINTLKAKPRSTVAFDLMCKLNPNHRYFPEQDYEIFLEDVGTPAEGFYLLEYQALPDGSKALAFVRSNPWDRKRPGAGLAYQEAHVSPSSGSICVGSSHTEVLKDSIYTMEYVVARSRYWAMCFDTWQECGRKHSFNDIAMGRVAL